MSQYLLDTGPLGSLLNASPEATRQFTPWLRRRDLQTSWLVYGELIEHLRGSRNFTRLRSGLHILLRSMTVQGLSRSVVERYADIRRRLRPPYGPGLIGNIDTLIAATALESDVTLVTFDRDYLRVPGLTVSLLRRTDFA